MTSRIGDGIPIDVAYAIERGILPLRAWREHRKMTQEELSERSNVSQPLISYIEMNRKKHFVVTMTRLAAALDIPVENLITKGPEKKAPRPLSPVSYAGPDDLEPLLIFLQRLRGELEGGRAEEDLVIELARDLVERRGGIVLVVRGLTEIEASMGLLAMRSIFSRSFFFRAVWNVVTPEARSTGHARSLLLEARRFADSVGRMLWIDEMTPNPESGKAKLIGRHLPQAGAMFIYDPHAITHAE